MSASFELGAETGARLSQLYIGSKTTIWFSYGEPVAFAVSGLGRFKVAESAVSRAERKHLRTLPARAELTRDEFNARLAELADGLDAAASVFVDNHAEDAS